jgi:hypothetical protein
MAQDEPREWNHSTPGRDTSKEAFEMHDKGDRQPLPEDPLAELDFGPTAVEALFDADERGHLQDTLDLLDRETLRLAAAAMVVDFDVLDRIDADGLRAVVGAMLEAGEVES